LGYDKPDKLLAILRSQDDQFYDKPGHRQDLLALLREKREVSDFESEVVTLDGDLLWIMSTRFGPAFCIVCCAHTQGRPYSHKSLSSVLGFMLLAKLPAM
jgi:hypothetical protein